MPKHSLGRTEEQAKLAKKINNRKHYCKKNGLIFDPSQYNDPDAIMKNDRTNNHNNLACSTNSINYGTQSFNPVNPLPHIIMPNYSNSMYNHSNSYMSNVRPMPNYSTVIPIHSHENSYNNNVRPMYNTNNSTVNHENHINVNSMENTIMNDNSQHQDNNTDNKETTVLIDKNEYDYYTSWSKLYDSVVVAHNEYEKINSHIRNNNVENNPYIRFLTTGGETITPEIIEKFRNLLIAAGYKINDETGQCEIKKFTKITEA